MPDEAIAITFTGRRPGEKLQEELVGSDETVEQSPVGKIQRVVAGVPALSGARLLDAVGDLERAAAEGDQDGVFHHLNRLVPTYSRSIELAGV